MDLEHRPHPLHHSENADAIWTGRMIIGGFAILIIMTRKEGRIIVIYVKEKVEYPAKDSDQVACLIVSSRVVKDFVLSVLLLVFLFFYFYFFQECVRRSCILSYCNIYIYIFFFHSFSFFFFRLITYAGLSFHGGRGAKEISTQ